MKEFESKRIVPELPGKFLGFAEWLHFYAGAWLFPIMIDEDRPDRDTVAFS